MQLRMKKIIMKNKKIEYCYSIFFYNLTKNNIIDKIIVDRIPCLSPPKWGGGNIFTYSIMSKRDLGY